MAPLGRVMTAAAAAVVMKGRRVVMTMQQQQQGMKIPLGMNKGLRRVSSRCWV
jgi:hypothetical protein